MIESIVRLTTDGTKRKDDRTVNFATDSRREIADALRDNKNRMIQDAHNRVQEQAREQREQQRRARPRRSGAVRLSNMDSMRRARQVRSRLNAKLMEIQGSDMEERTRGAAAMDVKLQISRVDQQMAAIRRRERAEEQERTTRRENDTPEARRRRRRDMQEQRITIRRDFLYHANNGGFDPNNPLGTPVIPNVSSAALDFGGGAGAPIMDGADFSADIAADL